MRNRDDIGTKGKAEMVKLEEIAKGLVLLKTSRSLDNKLL